MGWKKMIIRFGGQWDGLNYKGGEEEVLPIPPCGMTYSGLLENIQSIVQADIDRSSYILYSLDKEENITRKMKIKNDNDVEYILQCINDLVIFVTVKETNIFPNESVVPFSQYMRNYNFQPGSPYISQPRTSSSSLLNADIVEARGVPTNFLGLIRDQADRSNVGDVGEEDGGCGQYIGDTDDDSGTDDSDFGEKYEAFERFCDFLESKGRNYLKSCNSQNEGSTFEQAGVPVEPGSQETLIDDGHIEPAAPVPPTPLWLIPGIPTEQSPPCIENSSVGVEEGTLKLGSMYNTKQEMLSELGRYHLRHKSEYRTSRSDKTRYCVVCKHNGCGFIMQANGKGGIWRVFKLDKHTCLFDSDRNAPQQLPSKVLGEFFASSLLVNGAKLAPKTMMEELHKHHALQIHYNLALKAKNHAMAAIFGDVQESFRRFPSYLNVLEQYNPGSVTAHLVDSRGMFKSIFYALAASIAGFRYGRPVIVVDGINLKGKYRGILFIAVTKDGNGQFFPLAIGIGDVESEESWTWFMQKMKVAFDCPDNLLIVSDKHLDIEDAIRAVFPQASHGLCCYNLQNNLAKYGKHVVAIFNKAAYCYRLEEHNKYKANLESASKAAFDHLVLLGESRWSRTMCRVRRFDFMDSNAAKNFNSRLLWARQLPVCSILEVARSCIEQWFCEQRASANDRVDPLTNYASTKLLKAIEDGSKMEVDLLASGLFNVKDEMKVYVVNLAERTCSCREFEYELMPCSHATAAIRTANHDQCTYVADFYKTSTLQQMWAGIVMAVPDPKEWVVPSDVLAKVCEPPETRRQAGRPKENRHSSGAESSSCSRKSQLCGRCHTGGHNRVRCTCNVPLSDTTQSTQSTKRTKKRCSICHDDTHTRPRCPQRPNLNIPNP